jgi:hypothetical protein
VIDHKSPAQSNSTTLPSHIAETVDAVAQIHADHHLKRTPVEKFMDDWTARLARPPVLAAVVRGVVLWIAAAARRPACRAASK